MPGSVYGLDLRPGSATPDEVGGGESGWVAPHPGNANIFFAGSTNVLTRVDRRSAWRARKYYI